MDYESVSEAGSATFQRLQTSVTARKIARSSSLFAAWAASADLIPPLDWEPESPESLPPALQNLLATSKIVPSWTYNSQAPQHDHIRQTSSNQIAILTSTPTEIFTTSDDPELSKDVECSLVHVFVVVERTLCLEEHAITRPNDAD
ncbi:hypothetical protein FS749_015012, partial [Ceratobasidium sp. UAMH 11750]